MPPAALITGKPDLMTNVTTASFTFASSDKALVLTCSVDGAAFVACPKGKFGPVTKLAEGQHIFVVRTGDAIGNQGLATWLWTVDLSPISVPGLLSTSRIITPTQVTYCVDAAPDVSGMKQAEWSIAAKSPSLTAKPVSAKLLLSRAVQPGDGCRSNLALATPVVVAPSSAKIKWMRF